MRVKATGAQLWEGSMNRRRASQDTGPPATDPEGEMNMDSNSTVFQPGTPVAMRVSIRIVYLVLPLFLVFAIESPPLFGQQRGNLSGTVRDPLGAFVVNASVDLLIGDHVIAITKTGQDGAFHFNLHKPDRYSVRVSAASFGTTTSSAEYIGDSGKANFDITLASKTLTQQVTVTASGTPTPVAQTGASVTVIPAEVFRFM